VRGRVRGRVGVSVRVRVRHSGQGQWPGSVARSRASILAVGRTAAMEVEVDVILREVGQHRRRDVRRVPQI